MIMFPSAQFSAFHAMREANKAADAARLKCEAALQTQFRLYEQSVAEHAIFIEKGGRIVVMGRTVA